MFKDVVISHILSHISPRSVAIGSVATWIEQQSYIDETLCLFFQKADTKHPFTIQDKKFCYEIALGTVRKWFCIAHYVETDLQTSLPKEPLQQACLFVALYQRLFHDFDKKPYALVYEYVEVAKKLFGVCNPFHKYMNALLRKSIAVPSSLFAQDETAYTHPNEMSLYYSVSQSLIEKLVTEFGTDHTKDILRSFNTAPHLYTRLTYCKEKQHFPIRAFHSFSHFCQTNLVDEQNSPFYIQNPSQPHLIEFLIRKMSEESQYAYDDMAILDVCSAPGGKATMLYQVFQPKRLIANDISHHRLSRLYQNLQRFSVQNFEITNYDGTCFPIPKNPTDLFDLVVVDAPCSNSGVLFKCPEARYRLNRTRLRAHVQTQKKLLAHATNLTRPKGFIWYMTCSILPEENRHNCTWLESTCNVKILHTTTCLPTQEGLEGGFAALIYRL